MESRRGRSRLVKRRTSVNLPFLLSRQLNGNEAWYWLGAFESSRCHSECAVMIGTGLSMNDRSSLYILNPIVYSST